MKDERRERARLEGIIALQTTDMTPLSKTYYAGEKRKVIEYLSSRELFSSSSSETRQRELFPQAQTTIIQKCQRKPINIQVIKMSKFSLI